MSQAESLGRPGAGRSKICIEKKYAVIRFLDLGLPSSTLDEEISAVPKIWLYQDKGNFCCRWPPKNKNFEKLMKNQTPAELNWKSYNCQIIREFEEYSTAKLYETKIIQLESSESETQETLKRQGRGCRKKISRKMADSESTDSSSGAWSDSEVIKNFQSIPGADSNLEFENIQGPNNFDVPEPNIYEELEKTLTVISEDIPVQLVNDETQNGHNCCKGCANRIEVLSRRIIEMNLTLSQLVQKCSLTGENINNVGDLIVHLPIQNIDELEEMEKNIENNDKYRDQLGKILMLIGGVDGPKSTRRCLGKIFSDQLAAGCSWTGAKNNYKIEGLNIIAEIKNVVRKQQSITDFEFERIAKDFFRYAVQRTHRKEKSK